MNLSKIQFGIFEEPTPSFGRIRTHNICLVGRDRFLATTQKEFIVFEGRDIKSRYPYKCSTSVFIEELEIIVGLTQHTNQFIAFQINNTESVKLLLSGIDSKHVGVFHMVYSPKSHAILTVGNGIKVWTLSSDKWSNRKSSIPPHLNLTLRSSFAPNYQTQILNPPTFDYVNEYILLPTPTGLRPFDLDGNCHSPVSLYPSAINETNNTLPGTTLRTSVYTMWSERSKKKLVSGEYKIRKNYLTSDTENGMCIWGTQGKLKKRIVSTSSDILMIQYLDSQNVIFMDSRGIFYLLNIYTERFFPCYMMDKLPSKVFILKTVSGIKIVYCQDLSFNMLRIEIPWSAWVLGLRDVREISRCPRLNDAARIIVFTNNSFIKLFATQNGNLITAATQKSSSPSVGYLYDRGLILSTKYNEEKNITEYIFNKIRESSAHDQLFTILDNGDIVGFDTSVQPANEIFSMQIRCNAMKFAKYDGQWNYALVGKESDIFLYDYDTLKQVKRFRISNESIIGFHFHAESECGVVIFQNEVVLYDFARAAIIYNVKTATSQVSYLHGNELLFGHKNGSIGRVIIKNRCLVPQEENLRPHTDAITGFSFGQSFWATCSMDKTVQIWDYRYSALVKIELPIPIYSCEFLNGKRDLLLATDNEIMIIQGSLIFGEGEVDVEIPEIDNFDKIKDALSTTASIIPYDDDEEEEAPQPKPKEEKPDLLKQIELKIEKENRKAMQRIKSYKQVTSEITGNPSSSSANKTENSEQKETDVDDEEKRRLIDEMTAMTNVDPELVAMRERREEERRKKEEQEKLEKQLEEEKQQQEQQNQEEEQKKKPKKKKKPELSATDLMNQGFAKVEEMENRNRRRKARKSLKKAEQVKEEEEKQEEIDLNDLDLNEGRSDDDEFKDYVKPAKREVKIEINLVKKIPVEEPKSSSSSSSKSKPSAPKEEIPSSPRHKKRHSVSNKTDSPLTTNSPSKRETSPVTNNNNKAETEQKEVNNNTNNSEAGSVKSRRSEASKKITSPAKKSNDQASPSPRKSLRASNSNNNSGATKSPSKHHRVPKIPAKTSANQNSSSNEATNEENKNEQQQNANQNSSSNDENENVVENNDVISDDKTDQRYSQDYSEDEENEEEYNEVSPTEISSPQNSENQNQENYNEYTPSQSSPSEFSDNSPTSFTNSDNLLPRRRIHNRRSNPEITQPDQQNNESNNNNNNNPLSDSYSNTSKIIKPRTNRGGGGHRHSLNVPLSPPLSARAPESNNQFDLASPVQQNKPKKRMKDIDPQMAHLLGVSEQPEYLSKRAPTPPPIRWGNSLMSNRRFNPKYDCNRGERKRTFVMPPPNIVIDPMAVLAEYGKGWDELKPLVDKLLQSGILNPSDLEISKLFTDGPSPPSMPKSSSPRRISRRNSTLLPAPEVLVMTSPTKSHGIRQSASFALNQIQEYNAAQEEEEEEINEYYNEAIGGQEVVSPLSAKHSNDNPHEKMRPPPLILPHPKASPKLYSVSESSENESPVQTVADIPQQPQTARPRRRHSYLSCPKPVLEDNPLLEMNKPVEVIEKPAPTNYKPFWMSIVENEPAPDASPIMLQIRSILLQKKEEIEKVMNENPNVVLPKSVVSYVQNNADEEVKQIIKERKHRKKVPPLTARARNKVIMKPFWGNSTPRKNPRKEFLSFDGAMKITRIPIIKPPTH